MRDLGVKRRAATRAYSYLKTHPKLRRTVVDGYKRMGRAFGRIGRRAVPERSNLISTALTSDWLETNQTSPNPAILRWVGEPETVRNPPARNINGHVDKEYLEVSEVFSPAPFVVEIPDGRVVGEHGVVVTPDGTVLKDISWPEWVKYSYQTGRDDAVIKREYLMDARLPARRITGTVAVLSSYAGRGYFHWIFDVLPRLGLLQQAGYRVENIDHFVIPMRMSGFHFETLEALGIPESRLVTSFHNRHVVADRLVAPSITRPAWVTPTWVVHYLREAFRPLKPASNGHSKRLYIVRKTTDHGILGNEERLFSRLEALGFQRVAMEDYSLREKAWLLGQSEAIIGPSGAGLANIVFCRPGTKVIELRVQPFPVMEEWDIGNRCELDYYDVLPDSGPTRERSTVSSGTISESAVLATLGLAGLTADALS